MKMLIQENEFKEKNEENIIKENDNINVLVDII